MTDSGPDSGAMRAEIIAALPRLRRFCRGLTGHGEDGDDLMQSTVERALARAYQFETGSRVDAWMFRIARNLHIDAIRSARRRGPQIDIEEIAETSGEDGRDTVENRSDLAAAQRALQSVPEDQRSTFLLVVVEGLSYREAAEVLEVPLGTIMSRLARARARIDAVVGRSQGGLQ